MADDKRTINLVQVDAMTHEWLIQEANKAGQKIGEFAGLQLDRLFLGSSYNRESSNPLVRARDYLVKHERIQAAAKDVYKLAAIYLTRPEDTDLADDLHEMCESLGLDMQQIIEMTQNTPFLTIVNNTRGKFGQCVDWLSNLLVQHPVIASATVIQMAADIGYNKTMLERAKIHLNNSDMHWQIKSIHNGTGWEWHLTKIEDTTDTMTISLQQYRTTQTSSGQTFDE